MSSRHLVIFTEKFPYYGGEQFLELEIKFLSSRFDKIIIVPRISSGTARRLPENVRIFISPTRLSFYEIVSLLFDGNFVREILSNRRFSSAPRGFFRLFNFAIYGKRVLRLIKALSPDFIDSTYFYSYWMSHAAVGVAWAKKSDSKLKFISRAHGWDVYFHIHNPPYLPFRSLIFDTANMIRPVSQDGVNYMKRYSFVESNRISVARLGVAKASNLSKQSEDEYFRIVSCSNMVSLKRIEIIIELIARMAQYQNYNKKIQWIHFGDGPLKDKLTALATESFSNQVVWEFTGEVKNSEILNFYSKNPVDLFINTSLSEGIPVSIMEAQAHGIPVLATNVGGVSEIVNCNNGFLLNVNFDIEEALQYMIKISTDNALMRSLRDASLLNWQVKYNAEKNYGDFYDDIISMDNF